MSIEGWITLWSALLWLSAGAFGLVTVYVAIRTVGVLVRK
jgi:hypothetical protein